LPPQAAKYFLHNLPKVPCQSLNPLCTVKVKKKTLH